MDEGDLVLKKKKCGQYPRVYMMVNFFHTTLNRYLE